MKGAERNNETRTLNMETMLAYLQGEFSEKKSREIEGLIQGNPLYQQAIEELRQSLQEDPTTREKAIQYRDAFVQEVHRKGARKVHPHRRDNWQLWSMAAMILLLIIPLGYRVLNPSGTSIEDELIAEHYTEFSVMVVRGSQDLRDPSVMTPTEKLESNFTSIHNMLASVSGKNVSPEDKEQGYQTIISALNDLLNQEETDIPQHIYLGSNMYLGAAYLATGQPEKSEDFFQVLIDDGKSGHYADARWYKAWAHMEQGEIEAAKKEFVSLANDTPNGYKVKAKEIVQQLD